LRLINAKLNTTAQIGRSPDGAALTYRRPEIPTVTVTSWTDSAIKIQKRTIRVITNSGSLVGSCLICHYNIQQKNQSHLSTTARLLTSFYYRKKCHMALITHTFHNVVTTQNKSHTHTRANKSFYHHTMFIKLYSYAWTLQTRFRSNFTSEIHLRNLQKFKA
jgi:uncharacterized protein YeaC (DUF1315 family)